MRAGQLRHRVTVQSKTTVTDTQLGRTVTWGAVLSRAAARVEVLDAGERLQSEAIGSQVQYRVTLRALGTSATITPSMRLVWHTHQVGDRTLEIHGVVPSERGESLVLSCGAVA